MKETPEPPGQKFPIGARVKIADDLGQCMAHFPKGKHATVKYTYAHAYGGNDVKSYSLDVDGHGGSSWYKEHQLTAVQSFPFDPKGKGEHLGFVDQHLS